MKAVARRLQRLEERFAPRQDERDLRMAEVLRERRCRSLAQERGVPYEQVLREDLVERQTLMDDSVGDGSIADTLRWGRRRLELSRATKKNSTEPMKEIR